MRILWLKTELLHPVDKGGRIRTYCMLRELKRDHRITYLTLDDGTATADARERADEYCHELVIVPLTLRARGSLGFLAQLACNVGSRLPYVIARYKSPAQHAEIEKKVGGGDVDVLVCDFLTPSVNVPASLPCPAVLFQHNVEAVIWRRHYEVRSNPLARLFFRQQWRKMLAYERSVCRAYNHVVAVSPEDRDIMRDEYGLAKVSDVPTGVDTQYFRPAGRVCSEPYNLVFSGSMDWLPNEDAVWYFAKTILPRIAAEIPRVTLTVVGRKPSARLTELARNDPRLHVTGYVDDVRPYLERAGVYVVPLRIGSGTRLKIFEAMAMEKPVVATPVGAEGLRVTDGRELLLADSPDAFADAVVRLLRDRKLAKALAIQGACRVRRDFGWQNTAARFAEICERVLRDEAGRPDHLAICRPAV